MASYGPLPPAGIHPSQLQRWLTQRRTRQYSYASSFPTLKSPTPSYPNSPRPPTYYIHPANHPTIHTETANPAPTRSLPRNNSPNLSSTYMLSFQTLLAPPPVQVRQQQRQWRQQYEGLSKALAPGQQPVSWEEFLWALENVRSRAFSGPYTGVQWKLELSCNAGLVGGAVGQLVSAAPCSFHIVGRGALVRPV